MVEMVKTLPGRYFYDPAIFEQEQLKFFGTLWCCVGRADELQAAGDYRLVSVAGESIIVARADDGALYAFLNVCRHRGARICTAEKGTATKGTFQCPYHAWSYGLDGQLLGAPNLGSAKGFDRSQFGLVPVRIEVWEGLVWLNLSESPGSVAEQLDGPLQMRFPERATFERYQVGALKVGQRIEYTIDANWKLIIENFMECYHCGPVHPELVRLLPAFRNGLAYQEGGTAFADDVEAFTLSGKGSRPRLPGLTEAEERTYTGFVLWPNVLINLLPDHVILHTLLPETPTRSRVVCDWLFDAGEVAKPDFDPQDTVAVFDVVNRQDWQVCELAQLGMTSRAYATGGVYVPNERHIAVFRDLVTSKLNGSPMSMTGSS
jgi:Rieske 2Fe-2S family protein